MYILEASSTCDIWLQINRKLKNNSIRFDYVFRVYFDLSMKSYFSFSNHMDQSNVTSKLLHSYLFSMFTQGSNHGKENMVLFLKNGKGHTLHPIFESKHCCHYYLTSIHNKHFKWGIEKFIIMLCCENKKFPHELNVAQVSSELWYFFLVKM